MKKFFLLCFVSFNCFENSFSQAGEWTWMHGTQMPQLANFGVQGVSSPTNMPPSVYDGVGWTDLQGNFWVFGGSDGNGDLWKFDVTINEWTWVNGSGLLSLPPVFGTKGVASPLVQPNCCRFGANTWTDLSGNLWLLGGTSSIGYGNTLWKYNPGINMWTWVSGDNFGNSSGVYGVQGVPSVLNSPPARAEATTSWVDNAGNLWLFGGLFGNFLNDLWKFDVLTGEWTWMHGNSIPGALPVYGTRGIADPANTPGGRISYSHWKDNTGNLWLFGGGVYPNGNVFRNDMWKYEIAANEWTWMSGTNFITDTQGNYGFLCSPDTANTPSCRFENKACWTDLCGNFWMFGGIQSANLDMLSDLWKYNPVTNAWTLVNGSPLLNQPANYGTLGVSDPLNFPGGRAGACSWMDNNGNFWMGFGMTAGNGSNNIWRYVPDTSCGGANAVNIFASDPQICSGSCTQFQSSACNLISCLWSFPGATPDSSTDLNPADICYANSGTYDVQLIATTANGVDTLILTNYITVHPAPLPQSIVQSGDTLFADAGATAYQWYYNGNVISGATNYFYLASQSGDYNLIATDSNGCEVEAAIFNVIAIAQSTVDSPQSTVFPNPVGESLSVIGYQLSGTALEISIYNMMGALAGQPVTSNLKHETQLDVSTLAPGLYFLEITSPGKTVRAKFIKQ